MFGVFGFSLGRAGTEDGEGEEEKTGDEKRAGVLRACLGAKGTEVRMADDHRPCRGGRAGEGVPVRDVD